jgi:hypothetical protein
MQSQPPPPYISPQPRQRPKPSGCVIALIVVGALVVLGCIAMAVGVAIFLHSDSGKKVAGIIGEGYKMSTEAQNAPGAREIEKAGCSQGMIFDLEKSYALAEPFLGDGSADKPKFDFHTMVLCQVNGFGSPPTCDDVKRAYLAAVPEPSEPFLVQVKTMTETRPRCMNLYDHSGTFLKDLRHLGR